MEPATVARKPKTPSTIPTISDLESLSSDLEDGRGEEEAEGPFTDGEVGGGSVVDGDEV